MNFSIGVFDSGVGGLSVLEHLRVRLPKEQFIYFADTANMPYGAKTLDEVAGLTEAMIAWLRREAGVKMLVAACNTASAAIRLRGLDTGVPCVNIVEPVCHYLVEKTAYRKIGLMATSATIASGYYQKYLSQLDVERQMVPVPCDGLAKNIEDGQRHSPETLAFIEKFTRPLIEARVDSVVLGCTHYPHVRREIAAMLPPEIEVLDPAEYVADAVMSQLSHFNLSATPENASDEPRYVVNGDINRFLTSAQTLPLKALHFTPEQTVHASQSLLSANHLA